MGYLIDTNVLSELRKGEKANNMKVIFYGSLRDPDIRATVLGRTALSRILLRKIRVKGDVEYAQDGKYIVFVSGTMETCPVLLASGLTYTWFQSSKNQKPREMDERYENFGI
ncbi:MAG: type II toxin-antitoxin system VapC family toxin [Gammaproteobacteria bacterium]|nr:type II toxin-antitoxin system VapC family toxin [Gammaproteobacteria bacterium]